MSIRPRPPRSLARWSSIKGDTDRVWIISHRCRRYPVFRASILPAAIAATIAMMVVIVIDRCAEQDAPDKACRSADGSRILRLFCLFAVPAVVDIDATAVLCRSGIQSGCGATHLGVICRFLRSLAARQRHQKHQYAGGYHKLSFHDPSHNDQLTSLLLPLICRGFLSQGHILAKRYASW